MMVVVMIVVMVMVMIVTMMVMIVVRLLLCKGFGFRFIRLWIKESGIQN